METTPFSFAVPLPVPIPSRQDNHIQRRLSALKGQFLDTEAYARQLAEEDRLVYEVYEIQRPHVAGERPTEPTQLAIPHSRTHGRCITA